MAQLGFFDADKRLEALSAKGDPLEAIDRLVPWESFRAEIEAVVLTPDELKKSSAGLSAVASHPGQAASSFDDNFQLHPNFAFSNQSSTRLSCPSVDIGPIIVACTRAGRLVSW